MVYIYTKKEFIPNNKQFIFDVDAYLATITESIDIKDSVAAYTLDYFDEAEFISSNFVRDRFGSKLPIWDISTSSKCILCALFGSSDNVYNFNELDSGGITLLKDIRHDVFIYVPRSNIDFGLNGVVCVNGIKFEDSIYARQYIWTGGVSNEGILGKE